MTASDWRALSIGRWAGPARAVMAGAMLLGTFAGTCGDPTPLTDRRIGVAVRDEHVTALYVLCPNERVTNVRLYSVEGVIVGDKDDTLLWRITGKPGATAEVFPVGSVPSGFDEPKPLEGSLPESRPLSFTISSNRQNIAAQPFRVRDLQPGMVFSYPDRLMPLNEFFSRGERQCV